MSGGIAARLEAPQRRVTPQILAGEWFHQVVTARLEGLGLLASHPRLLARVRGALGDRLVAWASPEAVSGKPCPWEPPCTLDVFFREQARVGRHGLAKPYVLSAQAQGRDLLVQATVFGFACDWTMSMRDALAEALRTRMRWRDMARDVAGRNVFLPSEPLRDLSIHTVPGLDPGETPGAVRLQFLTPVDASGVHPLDEPGTLIARLARRIDGLARWQDAALDICWDELRACWRGLSFDTAGLAPATLQRISRRQGRRMAHEAVFGDLGITGDLAPLWPFLIIGLTCHIGRGAVAGMGRYQLMQE